MYRATDTNLKRQVAIKVLPASVAGDADRLARFQREAEVLAALNHPNIAAIMLSWTAIKPQRLRAAATLNGLGTLPSVNVCPIECSALVGEAGTLPPTAVERARQTGCPRSG